MLRPKECYAAAVRLHKAHHNPAFPAAYRFILLHERDFWLEIEVVDLHFFASCRVYMPLVR